MTCNYQSKQGSRQAWWHIPVILAFKRPRQEDHEFEASLGYIAKPSLKTSRAEDIAQWYSACLAKARIWVLAPNTNTHTKAAAF
jgi:hypothetical protein